MPHCSTELEMRSLSFRPGDVVAGKFRIDGIIGAGGMGIVVAATHVFLREPVALKFLRPELLAHPELVARFAFEARAAAKIKSEHVARVLDVGEVDGVPFMVLEHLAGRDLGSRLLDSGALTLREAAEIVIQVCEALAEAHALGIVHRDVKPENLFLVERGGYRLVKLIDFGISKAPEPTPPSVRGTHRSAATADEVAILETGEIMGSPSYMSPEQLSQGRLDARTDIWSLGAVLYELLTGATLFDSNRPLQEIMSAVLYAPIPSVLSLRPDLPLAIAGLLSRCLAREPELRFQSAAELAVALLPFAPRRSREAAERAVSHVRSSGASEPRLPSSEAPRAPSSAPRMQGEDPMMLAMPPGPQARGDYRVALRPALLPYLPSLSSASAAVSAATVRIERVPTALDSSPATAHSVEPSTRIASVRARRPVFALAVAACAILGAAIAGGQAATSTALGLGLMADVPALRPQPVSFEAPAVLAFFETFAEPSLEVLVLDYDASVRAAAKRRLESNGARPCDDDPYGCDDDRP